MEAILPLPKARSRNREQPAAYIGVSASLLDETVRDNRIPQPRAFNARRVSDSYPLDKAFDNLPGGEADEEERSAEV